MTGGLECRVDDTQELEAQNRAPCSSLLPHILQLAALSGELRYPRRRTSLTFTPFAFSISIQYTLSRSRIHFDVFQTYSCSICMTHISLDLLPSTHVIPLLDEISPIYCSLTTVIFSHCCLPAATTGSAFCPHFISSSNSKRVTLLEARHFIFLLEWGELYSSSVLANVKTGPNNIMLEENPMKEEARVDVEKLVRGDDILMNSDVMDYRWNGITVTVKDRATKQPKEILSNIGGHVKAGKSLPFATVSILQFF